MLKVKSFKMSEADAVNELMSKHILAEGASIFVSNGEIMIPYEDGVPMNNDQKFIRVMEDKNKVELQIDIISHSQKVLLSKVNGAVAQLNTLIADEKEAETKKEAYDTKKDIKNEKKRLESVIAQFEVNIVNNAAELTSKTVEIEVYNEEIKELEGK